MGKSNKKTYPSKTTLNLAMKESHTKVFLTFLPTLAGLAVVIGLFAKFGVVDRLDALDQAQRQLDTLTEQQTALEATVEGYGALREEHDRYSADWMNEADQALLLRTELLDIMEQQLFPYCQVDDLDISGNLMSMNLRGISLDGTSNIVQRLHALPQVANVEVHVVSSGDRQTAEPTVSMLITTQLPQEGGEG